MTLESELANPRDGNDYGYGSDDFSFGSQWDSVNETKQRKGFFREQVESVIGTININLIIPKAFYFFFFAAFGSLFPLIAVYFKQLGMNGFQTGLLIGCRPFVEYISAPFWGNIASRWRKGKQLLLFSLFCWVAFSLALAFIQPGVSECLVHNRTHVLVVKPFYADRHKRSLITDHFDDLDYPYASGLMKAVGTSSLTSNHGIGSSVDLDLHQVNSSTGVGNATIEKNTKSGLKQSQQIKGAREDVNKENINHFHPIRKYKSRGTKKAKLAGRGTVKNVTVKIPDDSKNAPYQNVLISTVCTNCTTTPSRLSTSVGKGQRIKVTQVKLTTPMPKPKTTVHYISAVMADKIKNIHLLPHPIIITYGLSPLPLDHKDIANLDEIDVRGLVSPPYSSVVYRQGDINSTFLLLLIIMILGEFLSAPAIVLADSATIGYLEDDAEKYGRQRMFGSIGWGLSMFFVGIALDHSNIFPNHPCGSEQLVDRNYTTCFAVFSVMMCCAFIAATRLRFKYEDEMGLQNTIALGQLKDKVIDKANELMGKPRSNDAQRSQIDDRPKDLPTKTGTGNHQPSVQRKLEINLQTPEEQSSAKDMITDVTVVQKPSPYVPRGKPGQFGTMPQWLKVVKMFGNIQYGSMLFILWYMGFGFGLAYAFLYWHLQDLQGTPTLFGMTSVIVHVAEIIVFAVSRKMISSLGHIKVLYIAVVINIARFLYISWLRDPWWVLPFEFIQGGSHAAVWAACCSYITQSTPTQYRATAQGILMGIHHGLGRGCGALIGGALVSRFGTENTFRGYGIACVFIFVAYVALDFFYIRKYAPSIPAQAPHQILEDTHLAPYGVPVSINRNISNQELDGGTEDASKNYYGATSGGYLDAGKSAQPHYSSGYSSEAAGLR